MAAPEVGGWQFYNKVYYSDSYEWQCHTFVYGHRYNKKNHGDFGSKWD